MADQVLNNRLSRSAPSPFTRLMRRYLRITLLSLVTGAFFAILWTVFALLLPAPRLRRPARNAIFRVWARICLRVIGGRVRVGGNAAACAVPARLQSPGLRRHSGAGVLHRRLVRRQDGNAFLAADRHALPFGGHRLHRPSARPGRAARQSADRGRAGRRLRRRALPGRHEHAGLRGPPISAPRSSTIRPAAGWRSTRRRSPIARRPGSRRHTCRSAGGATRPSSATRSACSSCAASTSSFASVPSLSPVATARSWPPTCTTQVERPLRTGGRAGRTGLRDRLLIPRRLSARCGPRSRARPRARPCGGNGGAGPAHRR